jgi:hypothetical protein
MATISGCRHLKVNLKAKIYIYVYSTTQRCPNKIIKIFLLEGFFHLPPVSLPPVANLELRISPRIFKKIRNGPNGIIRGLGETESRKKPGAKNLVTLSLLSWLPICKSPRSDGQRKHLNTATNRKLGKIGQFTRRCWRKTIKNIC